jgi:hypothetical protein
MFDNPVKKTRIVQTSCGTKKITTADDDLTLDTIVSDYIIHNRERATKENNFYKTQPNLDKAIEVAALCKLSNGKRHSHQRRIPASVLHQAWVSLRKNKGELEACKNFYDLIKVTTRQLGEVEGLGDLSIYDITHRIGIFLGLTPSAVYLHAGTREGAKALGVGIHKNSARMIEFPKAFQVLEPYEVEDCLCIYKDEIKMVAGR